jgi:CheY-like chemotaxis protein
MQDQRRAGVETQSVELSDAAEAARLRAVRLEALGQLTGDVAHDFNNLLMVIQGNVAILRRKLEEPVAQPQVEAIHQASEEATRLVRRLLTFARGGVVPVVRLDLDDMVDRVLPAVRELVGPNISVQSRRSHAPAYIDVCPVALKAGILNLAANARDAMSTGGVLEFATIVTADQVELRVSDTGEGMAPEVLARVFEPFFTTKAPGAGTGLGLAQVHGLAASAHGSVEISSTVGRGTTVTLRLPRALGEPERAGAEPAPQAPPNESEGPRVLLVDDTVVVRTTIASFLRSSSLAVREAGDAAEALALLETEPFDAIVSDIRMPGEMDGVGLAKAVCERRPDLPVVLMSGSDGAVAEAAAAGFTVLPKPLDLSDLMRHLTQA